MSTEKGAPVNEADWPKDPLLRALRALSILAFIVLLFIVLAVKQDVDVTTVGFLVGAILIQLSYDALVGVPGVISRRADASADKEAKDS